MNFPTNNLMELLFSTLKLHLSPCYGLVQTYNAALPQKIKSNQYIIFFQNIITAIDISLETEKKYKGD